MGWARDQTGQRVEKSTGQIDSYDDEAMPSASAVTSVDFIQDDGVGRLNKSFQSLRLPRPSAYTSGFSCSNVKVSWSLDRSLSSQPPGWCDYEHSGAHAPRGRHRPHTSPDTSKNEFDGDELDNDYRRVRYPTEQEYEYFCNNGTYMDTGDNRDWTYDPSFYSRTQVSSSSRLTDTQRSTSSISQSSGVTHLPSHSQTQQLPAAKIKH